MAQGFDYINAPQFFDFTKRYSQDDDEVDRYFVFDHEEQGDDPLQVEHNVNGDTTPNNLRRSMSVGDIHYLESALNNADILRNQQVSDCHSRDEYTTRSNHEIQKAKSQEFVDRLARPKKCGSLDGVNVNMNNYVSMAEAVKNFLCGTPDRFHSRKKGKFIPPIHAKMTITKPHTPHLVANKRTRPLNFLPREDRELLEFKEAQKFKIKANPLNKNVLHGPVKAPILKKSATIPEPFNLTRLPKKKVAESPQKIPEFHARPVPAAVKNKPSLIRTTPHKTVPITPTFMKRYPKESPKRMSQSKEEPKQVIVRNRRTQLMPFSFEVRDQQIMKKKENLIKRVMEEEKKAREFHANPIPKNVLQQAKNVSLPRNLSHKSLEKVKSNENLSTKFKARPATVLQKKPFIPKPSDKPAPNFLEFQLCTEQRTERREMFKNYVMEIEEQKRLCKEMEELRLKQEEAAEIAKQRKMAEHKAQPIRKYKEFHIEHVKQLTEPISPKFCRNRHNDSHANKENLANE